METTHTQGIRGNPPAMTRREVADRFRVTPRTVARWVETGRLTGWVTPGGQWRFDTSEVDRLAAELDNETGGSEA